MLLVSFGIGMKTKNVFQHPAFTCEEEQGEN